MSAQYLNCSVPLSLHKAKSNFFNAKYEPLVHFEFLVLFTVNLESKKNSKHPEQLTIPIYSSQLSLIMIAMKQ